MSSQLSHQSVSDAGCSKYQRYFYILTIEYLKLLYKELVLYDQLEEVSENILEWSESNVRLK
jgi:hypothetical protein